MSPNLFDSIRFSQLFFVGQRFFMDLLFEVFKVLVPLIAPRATNDNKLLADEILTKLLQILGLGVVAGQPVGDVVLDPSNRHSCTAKRKRQQKKDCAKNQHCHSVEQRNSL